jgi:uncharacterized tellurite resistance protein B-like protein
MMDKSTQNFSIHKLITTFINKFYKKMVWDLLTEDEKNRIVLKLLIHVSKADNMIHEREFAYLIYVCKNFNLDPQLIKEYAQIEDIKEYLPNEEQDRLAVLYHILFTMNADNDVSPLEEVRVYQLGFRLGFSEAMIRDFIELMKNHTIQDLSTEKMINVIRKHNN